MKVKQIGHYNLRGTRELMDRVKAFYVDVLGFREGFRPDFGIDGDWLYIGDAPLIHLTVVVSAPSKPLTTGNLHHIALDCEGLEETKKMLTKNEVDYQVAKVPELNMTQLFIHDPAGVRVELNFVQ